MYSLLSLESLSKPMLTYCQLYSEYQISLKFASKLKYLPSRKCSWICRLSNLSQAYFPTLWLTSNDAIWHHRFWSILVRVMTATSHYLNQYSLISGVLWHLPEGNFTETTQEICPWYQFEYQQLNITAAPPSSHWVNSCPPSAAYMHQWIGSALVKIMACRLFGAKPLSKPVLGLFSIRPLGTNFSEISNKIQKFSFKKMHLKMLSAKWQPFCPGVGDELIPAIRVRRQAWDLSNKSYNPLMVKWMT